MGRVSKGLPTIDDSLVLSISYLKAQGFLKQGTMQQGMINWKGDDHIVESIRVVADLQAKRPSLTLYHYSPNDSDVTQVKVCYRVCLAAKKSNLGKGYRYYFICPITGKNCIHLYKPWGNYFLHRNAYKGFYYESQLLNNTLKPFAFMLHENKIDRLVYKKMAQGRRIKSHYRGKVTRFLQRIEKLQKKSDISFLHFHFSQ